MHRPSVLLVVLGVFLWSCAPTTPAVQPAAGSGSDTRSRDAVLAGSDLPEPLARPLPGDPLGVTVHRLTNGLTVYISTDRQKPRISAWIAVRAGSRHDPPNSTGLAHYLEHMLFKGTDELGTLDMAAEKQHVDRIAQLYNELGETSDQAKREQILAQVDAETQKSAAYAIPNELDQLYARMGVRGLNAFTSDEQTVYIADVPKNRFEQWVRVEAERFRDPVFRLFYPELEAVYEEKNRSLDRPLSRVFEAVARALFPGHPYGTQPTIGLVEHLKTPAYADMVAYYSRWYVPNNMAIVLAGDIDAKTALPILEGGFGTLVSRPLTTELHGEVTPVAGRQQRDITASGESAVYLAWQTAPVGHADEAALEVMDWLMDNAASGLINVELVLSQKLPRAGSFPSILREAGMWLMYGVAREGQSLDQVEALLLGVVDKLKAGAFSQAELDAIILHAEMREMREIESNQARVGKMANAYIHRVPWPDAARRSEKLRRVSRDDVIAVAKRYLGKNMVVVRRHKGEHQPPKIPKPTITPIAIDPAKKSAFAGALEAMPIRPLEPRWLVEGEHYVRQALPSGEMMAVANRRNQLFAIDYRFEVGSRKIPLLCFALDLLEQSGTSSLSPDALKRKLYALGTTISVQCAADETWLSVRGIDRNMEASIALLGEWLQSAALTEDLYKKLLANELSKRKDAMDDPATVGRALSSYAAVGTDSQFLLVASNAQLQQARLAELRALLARLPNHVHRTLYFGPRSAADASKVVVLGRAHQPLAKRPPRTYRRVNSSRTYFLHKEVAQSSISITIAKPPLPAADIPLSLLYREYVGGGMGSLVFQEIREARGLAYSAFATHRYGRRPGDQSAISGFIGTQSDKTVEALATMLNLIRAMPMQSSRLATAVTTIDEEYRTTRIDPRQVARRVLEWEERGHRGDPRKGHWSVIRGLDQAALKGFAARSSSGPVIIGIMGDRSRIDMAKLAEIAPVAEVKIEQIFGY
ncbi:MAG: insulinase family protein [Proteobacteria bacterium]|nr:insulinase family protein [Pseudomonadota bacterium]